MPGHLHYDVTYAFRATGARTPRRNSESFELAWVPLDGVARLTNDPSVLRMVAKARRLGSAQPVHDTGRSDRGRTTPPGTTAKV